MDFDWQGFNKIYLDHSGFNVSIYKPEEKANSSHNFLYVMRLPEHHIYMNFDKKIF